MISMRSNKDQTQGLKDLIIYILRHKKIESVVEIGSFAGESTSIWADYAKDVYAIDPWIPFYDPIDPASNPDEIAEAERAFDLIASKKTNIHKIKKFSAEAVNLFTKVDVVYIDGNHKYESVLLDIKTWRPIAQVAICGHDYSFPQVEKAVTETLGGIDRRFKDTSWVKLL